MEKIVKIVLLLLSFNLYAFDHNYKKLEKFLSKYTKKINAQTLVNYSDINKAELKSVLDEFRNLDKTEFKSFSKNEKLAFWINAYNIFTIDLIVKNYPIESIKDIGNFFTNAWSIKFIKLLNKEMTLDEIEHGTIRKNFNEYRIHFAVNCASISCPSLVQKPFTSKELDQQLSLAEKNFLNNKDKNYLKKNTMYVSKIFDWYGEDFEQFGELRDYFTSKLKFQVGDIEFVKYNWKLNEYKKGQD
jgi:hypothetical protein